MSGDSATIQTMNGVGGCLPHAVPMAISSCLWPPTDSSSDPKDRLSRARPSSHATQDDREDRDEAPFRASVRYLRLAARRRRPLSPVSLQRGLPLESQQRHAARHRDCEGCQGSERHGATEISGGTASERVLLGQVVAGMQPTVIEKIEITAAGMTWACTSPPAGQGGISRSGKTALSRRHSGIGRTRRARTSPFHLRRRCQRGNHRRPGSPLAPAKPGDAAAARPFFENAARRLASPSTI